jgi:hypothetical protein
MRGYRGSMGKWVLKVLSIVGNSGGPAMQRARGAYGDLYCLASWDRGFRGVCESLGAHRKYGIHRAQAVHACVGLTECAIYIRPAGPTGSLAFSEPLVS